MEPLPTPSAYAVGPYSPAVRAGDWIVISGQIGIDPGTGQVVSGGVEAQARQAFANLRAILGDGGCSWEHVAKVTVFVAMESPQSMQEVNAIYSEIVGEHRPARSTVGVAWLPMGAAFEIEAWVHKPLNRPEA
ncbi:MAG: Rid family detoxifying hydrolase [Acidimicrobiia bacterium]